MKPLFTPLLLLSLVLCGLAGCASTTQIISAGLRIEVAGIQRDPGGTVQVTWRVHNPNVVSYVFTRSAHKLSLDGTVVGTLTDNSPLGVPQVTQGERTTPLTLANPAAATVLDRAVAQGSATYQLESNLWVLIVDEDTEKIPLQATGTTPVTAK